MFAVAFQTIIIWCGISCYRCGTYTKNVHAESMHAVEYDTSIGIDHDSLDATLYTSDNALCSFVAATNIATISGYSMWECDTLSSPVTNPCGNDTFVAWNGIVCLSYNASSVSTIFLNTIGLSGSIPSEIGILSTLEYFNLHSNSLYGVIPPLVASVV